MPAPKKFPLSKEHLSEDLIKQVTFMLPDDLKQKIEVIADALDVSINWVMRLAILMYALKYGYADMKTSSTIIGELKREAIFGVWE